MKRVILLILTTLICCATSQIDMDKSAVKQVSRITVAPFTSTLNLDGEILAGAENEFKKALMNSGINVIEQDMSDEFLKPMGSGITVDKIKEAGRKTGADAVLTGEITLHCEENRLLPQHMRGRFGLLIMNDDHGSTRWKTYLKFRIKLELINTANGMVILKMTNRYVEVEKDEELPGYMDINAYRRYTLKKMAKELSDVITAGQN